MKKTALSVLLLLVLYIPVSISQSFDLDWGAVNKISPQTGKSFESVIDQNQDDVCALRANYTAFSLTQKPFFAIYNKADLLLASSTPIFPKGYFTGGAEGPNTLYNIVKIKNSRNYRIFYNTFDRKESQMKMISEEYSPEGGLGKKVEMVTSKGGNRMEAGSFGFYFSQDSSKYLVVYYPQYKRYKKERFVFYAFNGQLEQTGEKEVTLPFNDSEFSIYSIRYSNDGKVYMLAKVSLTKEEIKEKGKRAPRYYFKLLTFDMNTSAGELEAQEIDVDLDNIFINGLGIEIDDEYLICTGYYGKENPDDISGMYYFLVDRVTGDQSDPSLYDFDKQFIAEFYTAKQAEKADKKGKDLDIPEIVLRQIIPIPGNGAIVVGEQFYIVERCYMDSRGNMRCVYYYYYNDIVVTRVSDEGEIQWVKKIPKKSVTRGYTYTGIQGYSLSMRGNDLYFLFNDHEKNVGVQNARDMVYLNTAGKMVTVGVKLDGDGNMSKEVLFSYKEQKMVCMISKNYGTVNRNDEMFFHAVKGSKYRLGRIILK